MKLFRSILLDHAGGGGGGGSPVGNIREEMANMLCMAQRHGKEALFQKAVSQNWSGKRFSDELLASLASAPIDGRAVSDSSCDASRTREGLLKSRNLGELVANSTAFKDYTKNKAGRRNFAENFDLLGTRDILGTGELQNRATLLTTGLTSYDRPPGIVLQEQQPLTIAQLFSQGETGAATIRFLRESAFTNGATAVGEEGQKPEGTFSLAEIDAPVKKVAVLARVSDEMLSDFPVTRDYLNSRLGYMVQAKEEGFLLSGTGLNDQITGVLNTSNIQNEGAAASSNTFDAFAKALNKVRNVGFFEPDSIVMHPTDWQMLQLIRDNNGRYYLGDPGSTETVSVGGYSAAGMLWKKPVITTTAITQGTALVGAFKLGGQIFRRMGLTLEMTNSDASDFQYNRTAIRCETRLALAIYRPLAFCTVSGIPA